MSTAATGSRLKTIKRRSAKFLIMKREPLKGGKGTQREAAF
jgi:hypothetical protein